MRLLFRLLLLSALGVARDPVDSVTISPADLQLSRAWLRHHFGVRDLNATAAAPLPPLPFSFVLGGRPSKELLPSWRREAVHSNAGSNIETHRLTFTDPQSGLMLTVNLTQYLDHPAAEWVLSFTNTGSQNTMALTEIRAVDTNFTAGTSSFELTHALGYGEGVPTDYMTQLTRIGCQPGCTCDNPTGWQVPGDPTCGCVNPGNPPGAAMQQPHPTVDRLTLGTNGGRSSSGGTICPPYDGPIGHQNNGSLPFFNLAIPGRGGIISAIGWSGQWQANFSCANSPTCHAPAQHFNCPGNSDLRFAAGQQHFDAYLRPGESFRTPSVVLMHYAQSFPTDHSLATRAHNLWRSLLSAHFTPKGEFPIAASCGGMCFANSSEQQAMLSNIHTNKLPLNAWWVDAGWWKGMQKPSGWWPDNAHGYFNCSLGDWIPNPKLYPNGMKTVVDAAHSAGLRMMLWFEVERSCNGSLAAAAHPAWVLQSRDFCVQGIGLLNLGNTDARNWITERVSRLIASTGLDHYRQDMNFDPLSFWQQHDRLEPGRVGLTEAHYIAGKYEYLDGLQRRFPHITIGGCAGGGRETDIESYRRTQMNSRADGFCAGDQLCSQGETYSLSLWLPRHGQSQSTMDGRAVDPVTGSALLPGPSDTEYSFHSFMSMSMAFEYDWGGDTPGGWGRLRGWLKRFARVRDLYDGDFFPLLPFSLSHFDWIGWQFHREDLGRGMVQLFRRANSSLASTTVALYGLHAMVREKRTVILSV